MNKRLLQFITAENISQSQFADNIGVARASVSHIISGRNKPGFDFVEKMARAFPALNVEWLITGRGKMYKTALAEHPQHPSNNDDYANDLFGDAYRDSLIATTVVQNGNDLLDAAFMDELSASEESGRNASSNTCEPKPYSDAQPSRSQGNNDSNINQSIKHKGAQENDSPGLAKQDFSRRTDAFSRNRPAAAPFGEHSRSIAKIIVFYDDGSYQELR